MKKYMDVEWRGEKKKVISIPEERRILSPKWSGGGSRGNEQYKKDRNDPVVDEKRDGVIESRRRVLLNWAAEEM